MAEPAVQPVNVAAFLEGDDATDTRCELIDGRPRTMAPLVAAGGAAPFQSPKIVNAPRQGLRLEDERADG